MPLGRYAEAERADGARLDVYAPKRREPDAGRRDLGSALHLSILARCKAVIYRLHGIKLSYTSRITFIFQTTRYTQFCCNVCIRNVPPSSPASVTCAGVV